MSAERKRFGKSFQETRLIKEIYSAFNMHKGFIAGCGVGLIVEGNLEEFGLKVYLSNNITPEQLANLPKNFEGVPIEYCNAGEVKASSIVQVIDRLLVEKGIDMYAIFEGTEEASKILPGGFYPYSGYILDNEGRVFAFWLDWDAEKGEYTLGKTEKLPDGTIIPYWHEVNPSDIDSECWQKSLSEAKELLGIN